jgi:hypothetical protein
MAYHRGDRDPDTAERLLSGWLSPDDAPRGYREVAQLLQATHTEGGPSDVTEDAVIVAMVDAIVANEAARLTRKHMLTRIVTAKAAAVTTIVTLTATAAAAPTGGLPDAAQDGIAEAVSHVGIDLPKSAEKDPLQPSNDEGADGDDTDDRPAVPAGTEEDDGTDVPATPADGSTDVPDTVSENHGAVVSDAAHNADPEGGKGEEVAPIARDNHGHEDDVENESDDAPGNGNGNAGGNGNGNAGGNGNGNGQP